MYRILYDSRIAKELRFIPHHHQQAILNRLESLATQPRQRGVEKLEFFPGYRVRVGNYRVLFTIDDTTKLISVYRIKHRREVYR